MELSATFLPVFLKLASFPATLTRRYHTLGGEGISKDFAGSETVGTDHAQKSSHYWLGMLHAREDP